MTPATLLDFWFAPAGSKEHNQPRRCWFVKDPAFDEEIRRDFGALLADPPKEWEATLDGRLALTLLFDQFPRNVFRNTPQAFAFDPRALALARQALESGDDRQLPPVRRVFLYLPFEHSESLADQDQSLALFAALAGEDQSLAGYLDYARRHREVIERFGRFPHRNAILGRVSTAEEEAYLATPGSGF